MSTSTVELTEGKIRRAVPEDIPALASLVQRSYRGETSRVGWTTEADLLGGQRTDADALATVLQAPNQRVYVWPSGSSLRGCYQLTLEREAAWLGMFAVDPTIQGRGYGSVLLTHAESVVAEDLQLTTIRMNVLHLRQELLLYYQRRGYLITNRRNPFPYGDLRFGEPKRADLYFLVLEKPLTAPLIPPSPVG